MSDQHQFDIDQIKAELLNIISEVLGEELPPIPDETPILDFVLSSLSLVEGMRKIYDHFGVLVSIRRVIEGQATLGGIATYIEQELHAQSRRNRDRARVEKLALDDSVRRLPISSTQKHTGFIFRYSPQASAAYNESAAVRLDGMLDGPAMQSAVDTVVQRYDALRTSLNSEIDELNIHPDHPLELHVSRVEDELLADSLRDFISAPFDLDDRLFRAGLFRSEDAHLLVLVSHSLVVDPDALRFVLGEIAQYYAIYSRNEDDVDPYPALQWADYLAMGEADVMQDVRRADSKYWQARLSAQMPRLELPTDSPRPAVKRYSGKKIMRRIGNDFFSAGDNEKQQLLLAVYSLYLSRLSGQKDFLIGVRSSPLYLDAAQPVVGQTRTMLPVRIFIDNISPFGVFTNQLARSYAEADAHRNFSLAELLQVLDLPRDQSRSPLFTAAYSYETINSDPDFGQSSLLYYDVPGTGSRYDVELSVVDIENEMLLSLSFSDELFSAETIERWLDGMEVALAAALAAPETTCGSLPMMSEKQLDNVLRRLNQTQAPIPPDRTVFDEFITTAQKSPLSTAVRYEDEVTTYGMLLNRVEDIARQLYAADVRRGDRVGILLERSADLIAALLASWRLGAQYVPLDMNFPEKRLMHMLSDANVATLLTRSHIVVAIPEFPVAKITILSDQTDFDTPLPDISMAAKQDDPAYIIYTSGSTGQPKGVQIGHASLLNLLLSVDNYLECAAGDSLLAITTISFDIAMMEVFLPLITGATVDIVPDGVIANSDQLIERMRSHRPTIMQATPSIWKMILADSWEGDENLLICSSGESLNRDLAEALYKRGRKLLNLYGPTEVTIYSAISLLESAPGEPVSIGKPISNTTCYILDDQLKPVPFGAVGELYFGGVGVAIGYWGQPELTDERFISDPFLAGGRIYRTGDLGRYLPNGEILCLGRIDHQVKVNGVRIELTEIELALRVVPGVSDAVVTVWKDKDENTRLVAHMIADSHNLIEKSRIRGILRENLPEVMIPSFMVFHDAFPMTDNGKILRSALPAPDIVSQDPGSVIPLESGLERSLAEIWGRLLKIDIALIGRESDFMDLGGHSLLIAPLLLEVEKRFHVRFGMREFFAASMLRDFTELIEQRMNSGKDSTNVAQYAGPVRNEAWGRERMTFLTREAELPPALAPVRGQVYQPVKQIRKLFMTGATGFLGAYLIDEILNHSTAELYCLVRPKRGEDERQRIEAQMRHYQVWRGDETWQRAWDERLHIVSGDVTLPRLGINDGLYDVLANEIDAILHSAAHVNFIYPYESLRGTNVGGVHEIIRFAFYSRIKPVHHVSTAAIWPMGSQYTFFEKDPITHGKVMNLGYDEAKWVAEMSLIHAGERGLPVVRYRPGEVGGDSVTGRCVTDHFLIASIKGFLQLGAFPELDIEVDVAPVDYVAKSIIHILFNEQAHGRAFHLTNPDRIHMSKALDFLRSLGYQFETMRFEPLRDRLLSLPNFSENAMFAYQGMLQDFDDVSLQLPTYDTRDTKRALRNSGITCPAADEKLFGTYLRYLREINFIPAPNTIKL